MHIPLLIDRQPIALQTHLGESSDSVRLEGVIHILSNGARKKHRKEGKGGFVGTRSIAACLACPVGTTRLARPICRASAAGTGRPVKIRSRARLIPISRGSLTVPLGKTRSYITSIKTMVWQWQLQHSPVDKWHSPSSTEDAEHGILLHYAKITPTSCAIWGVETT